MLPEQKSFPAVPRSCSCLMHSFYFLLKSKGRDSAMAEQPLTSAPIHDQPPLFPEPSSAKSSAFPLPSQNYSGFHTWHLLCFSSSALLCWHSQTQLLCRETQILSQMGPLLVYIYSWHPGYFLLEKCLVEACHTLLGLLQDSPSQFHPQWQAAGISWPGSVSGCPPSSWPPRRRSNICPCAAATRGDTAHTSCLGVDRGNI